MRISLILAVAAAAWAAPVDHDLARATAAAWLHARLEPGVVRQADSATPLPNAASPSAWLVPLNPEGFVLVSADDAMRPVLGWSEAGELAGIAPPPGLTDFLGVVDAELSRIRAAGESNALTRPEWDRILAGQLSSSREVVVQPLLSCTWDQGAGWNQFCPADGAGPGGRVWAGCVAVSMAQVMHYWQQPWHGYGSHGYMSDYGWLEADFSAATYDWNLIQANVPTEEAAELLYHCGIAVDMMYSPDGSGAYVGWGNPCALSAMRNNFGFLPSAQYVEKDDFSWAGWRNRLRQDLDAGRPILHCGYGSGGHAFNVDGWRDDDYFHLNWGWGGSFNGWFLIDALSPGGSDFSQGQGAVVNLVPVELQAAPQIVHPLNNDEDVDCTPTLFQWNAAPDAVAYDLQVDDTPDFMSPLVDLAALTEVSRSVESLQHYSQYYWRIRSRGEQGAGPWSPVAGFFTTYWDQTPAPQPVTPLNGASGVNLNPTVLVWNFVTGAISYDVQVDETPDFASPVVDTLGVLTHYHLIRDALQPEATYYWRSRCAGLAGTSEWSTVRNFTTESSSAIPEIAGPGAWELSPAWPNPFNPTTQLAFTLGAPARVDLRVHNLRGEEVARLLDGMSLGAGRHQVVWRADGLPTGTYLVVLEAGSRRMVRKATLLR